MQAYDDELKNFDDDYRTQKVQLHAYDDGLKNR